MTRRTTTSLFLTAAALTALLTGCTASDAPSAATTPATATAAPAPTEITTGLTSPWSIAFAGTTPLVSERDTGRILELDGSGESREVAELDDVVHQGEGGLLGLAVDEQSRLYAYSTGPDGNRIQRFDLAGSPGSLRLENERTILDGLPSATFHNGGRIAFGPDGLLYAGVGDAGDRASAQDLGALSGKILRMTADGGVPGDNPYPDSLVYSSGHRNVQGLGWAEDGTMFASEFGQDTWDELNIITAGANYGWPEAEGVAGGEDFVDPVQQWAPAAASPSGVAVLDGTVYLANLRGERLRTVPVDDPSSATDLYTGDYGRIRAVTPAPDGSIWFVTGNTNSRLEPREGDDRILRIDPL